MKIGNLQIHFPNSLYWFPIAVPILIGLILPLLQLQVNISQTDMILLMLDVRQDQIEEQIREELSELLGPSQINDFIQSIDADNSGEDTQAVVDAYLSHLRNFLFSATDSILVSLITIDVWALTILFTSTALGRGSNLSFASPVIALFLHICIIIVAQNVPEIVEQKTLLDILFILIAGALAFWVRNVIWRSAERPDQKNDMTTTDNL